jgi:hypothetical protein
MKRILPLFAIGSLVTTAAWATPLDRSVVAQDAKWVLHLDMEALRASQVGKFVIEKVIEPKFTKGLQEKNLTLSLAPGNISAVTAYGSKLQKEEGEGVLLIKTTADVKKDLETLTKTAAEEGKEISISQKEPYLVYNINDDFYVAPNIKGWVVVAKRKTNIEEGHAVLNGKKETLAAGNAFNEYPQLANTFFFLGMAQGFENTPVPPQAQVLKETNGGRLALGEDADKLFVNLVLRGKTAESAMKVQQVLQGLVALVTLSGDKPELMELARNTQITNEAQNVTVNLSFPVSKAINKIADKEGIEVEKAPVEEKKKANGERK